MYEVMRPIPTFSQIYNLSQKNHDAYIHKHTSEQVANRKKYKKK